MTQIFQSKGYCIFASLHLCIFASLTQIFQSKGSCIVVSPLYHRCIVASPRNDTPLFAQQAKKDLDQLSFSLRTKFGNSDKLRVKYVLHNQKLKLRIRLGDGEDSIPGFHPRILSVTGSSTKCPFLWFKYYPWLKVQFAYCVLYAECNVPFSHIHFRGEGNLYFLAVLTGVCPATWGWAAPFFMHFLRFVFITPHSLI